MLARDCAVVVIIDVLSFSTSVDIAVGRGARVLPQAAADSATADQAAADQAGATPAGPRDGSTPSLRPSSLRTLAAGTLLALPSPNGATLCTLAAGRAATVLVGCLRNASAVAAAARGAAGEGAIGLVPAGERRPDGTMRVAAEDALGAGAIAAALAGPATREPATARPAPSLPNPPAGGDGTGRASTLSPEAALAAAQFRAVQDDLPAVLAACASGRELLADGYGEDVTLAAELDVSAHAPHLSGGVVYSPRNNGHLA